MIHGISFECINDSRASYSFLITGREALEAAAIFNYSVNSQEYLITGDGISFRSHNSIKNVTTTLSPSIDNDSDTIDLHIFILVLVVVVTVGLILVVALAIGL